MQQRLINLIGVLTFALAACTGNVPGGDSGATVWPSYFIQLMRADGRVTAIRDFRFVPYAAREATITLVH
jgi:hypothetical protein